MCLCVCVCVCVCVCAVCVLVFFGGGVVFFFLGGGGVFFLLFVCSCFSEVWLRLRGWGGGGKGGGIFEWTSRESFAVCHVNPVFGTCVTGASRWRGGGGGGVRRHVTLCSHVT